MAVIMKEENQIYEQIIIDINCLNIASFMQKVYLLTVANWEFWVGTNIQNKAEWISN